MDRSCLTDHDLSRYRIMASYIIKQYEKLVICLVPEHCEYDIQCRLGVKSPLLSHSYRPTISRTWMILSLGACQASIAIARSFPCLFSGYTLHKHAKKYFRTTDIPVRQHIKGIVNSEIPLFLLFLGFPTFYCDFSLK